MDYCKGTQITINFSDQFNPDTWGSYLHTMVKGFNNHSQINTMYDLWQQGILFGTIVLATLVLPEALISA